MEIKTEYEFGQVLDSLTKSVMDGDLSKNWNCVLTIVKFDGSLLKYFDEFKNDDDIVLAAIGNFPKALMYATKRLKDDKNIAMVAVKNDLSGVVYNQIISDRLKRDKAIIFESLRNDPFNYNSIPDDLKNDKDIVLEALLNLKVTWNSKNEYSIKKILTFIKGLDTKLFTIKEIDSSVRGVINDCILEISDKYATKTILGSLYEKYDI